MLPTRHATNAAASRWLLCGLWLFLLTAVTCLSGCQSIGSSSNAGVARQDQVVLQRGMSQSQIELLLGEPEERRAEELGLETWVYVDTRSTSRLVEADTVEVPHINIVTREPEYRTEAVQTIQSKDVTLTTELFFRDGILIAWNENRDESVDWDD